MAPAAAGGSALVRARKNGPVRGGGDGPARGGGSTITLREGWCVHRRATTTLRSRAATARWPAEGLLMGVSWPNHGGMMEAWGIAQAGDSGSERFFDAGKWARHRAAPSSARCHRAALPARIASL